MAPTQEDTELTHSHEQNINGSLLEGTFGKMFTLLVKQGKFTKHNMPLPIFLLVNGHMHQKCNHLASWGNEQDKDSRESGFLITLLSH